MTNQTPLRAKNTRTWTATRSMWTSPREMDRARSRTPLLVLILTAVLALIAVEALARAKESAQSPAVKPTSKPRLAIAEKPDRLLRGVMAMRGHMRHVKRKGVELVATARSVAAAADVQWITPEFLLGLSTNESDLRWWLKIGLDCGIAQNRVNGWCRSGKCMKRLCKAVTKSARLSLEYAVDEMKKKAMRWCAGRDVYGQRFKHGSPRWWRCLLNTYNQGTWYYKRGHHARYWLRVKCFQRGYELGRAPTRKTRRGKQRVINCRRAKSLKWIERAYENGRRPGR